MTVIKHPFGEIGNPVLSVDAAQALTIDKSYTVVDGVTVEAATNNRTLNLTIDAGMPLGAQLFVMVKSNAAETTIFGTGMLGATITGTAGKTICALFIFDGTNFVQAGAEQQID
jgi:hypothetical protein